MSLDQHITDFLAKAGAKPATSKLEPYAGLVRTLRQRRWTYLQIVQALRDEFGLIVAPSTVHAFVKARAGKRKGVLTMSTPESPEARADAPVPAKRPRFNLDP